MKVQGTLGHITKPAETSWAWAISRVLCYLWVGEKGYLASNNGLVRGKMNKRTRGPPLEVPCLTHFWQLWRKRPVWSRLILFWKGSINNCLMDDTWYKLVMPKVLTRGKSLHFLICLTSIKVKFLLHLLSLPPLWTNHHYIFQQSSCPLSARNRKGNWQFLLFPRRPVCHPSSNVITGRCSIQTSRLSSCQAPTTLFSLLKQQLMLRKDLSKRLPATRKHHKPFPKPQKTPRSPSRATPLLWTPTKTH